MIPKSIYIAGASGFVGSNFMRWFSTRCNVMSEFGGKRPDAVINCIGYKDLKGCESNHAKSYAANYRQAKRLNEYSLDFNCRLVHISTDYIFGGESGNYEEKIFNTFDFNMISLPTMYGRHKSYAEKVVWPFTICRSAAIYGPGWKTGEWLRKELAEGRTVECWTDAFNTPTYVDNLAEMIWNILCNGKSGMFHTVGGQRVNRLEFFTKYCQAFGLPTDKLVAAQRPANCLVPHDLSLNSDWSRKQIAVPFNSVDVGMARWAKEHT